MTHKIFMDSKINIIQFKIKHVMCQMIQLNKETQDGYQILM